MEYPQETKNLYKIYIKFVGSSETTRYAPL
jgi:hypothetical protein